MKKTIIAASLTALAMGPGFVGASEHAVEGQPITVDGKGDLSPNSEMKLIGGWHYDKNTEKNDLDHSASNTNITLTGGTFDELIGGNHIKQPTAGDYDLKIGNTHVTLSGEGSVTYFIGGSKANNSDNTNLTTGDVTAVISGGTVTGSAMSWGNKDKISVVGGSYVKSTGAGGGTPASTTAETGNISLSISGGTFTGAVFGGSVADNYGEKQAESDSTKPDLSIKTGVSSLLIEGGTFQSSDPENPKNYDFGVFGGSAALGQKSSTESSGSSVTIEAKKVIDIKGRVVGGDLLGFGGSDENAASSKINGSTSVSITGSEKIETSESVIGGSYVRQRDSKVTNTASVTVESTSVTIQNGTVKGNVIGGGKVNGLQGTISNTVTGDASVTISGGTVEGVVIGGGHSKIGQGASGTMAADVEGQASIQMTGGTVHGVIGGGLSYAYDTTGKFVSTSAVGSSAVSISGDIR